MRLKIAREYLKRLFALEMLPLLAIVFVSFLLEFYYHPVDLLAYGGDPMALMMRRMLSLIWLGLKAVFSAIPLWIAMEVVMRLGSRFVNALYGVEVEKGSKEESNAFRRLLLGGASDAKAVDEPLDHEAYDDVFRRDMFGPTGFALRPIMIVKGGDVAVGAGGRLDLIGGPGILIVYNDSAAVLEKGGRLTRVVGPNTHIEGLVGGFCMLERFERVWEVIDLRSQHWPLRVDAMTKEGMPVSCVAQISFRIDDRFIDHEGMHRDQPTAKKPYSYTEETVVKAATGTWVRIRQKDHPEQLRKWTGRVMIGEVEGALRDILAQYRLDWLMRTPQSRGEGSLSAESSVEEDGTQEYKSPREEIRERLEARLHDVFKVNNPLGVQILDVALGEIDVRSSEISRQWMEVWRADWERRAIESLAEGEAEIVRMETAQVQAQAEMVLLLTDAIRPLVSDMGDFPPYLFAMRLVQTLRWSAYDPIKLLFLPPEVLRELDEWEKALNLASGKGVGGASPGQKPAEESWTELQRLISGRLK